jgi:hypothetical protein
MLVQARMLGVSMLFRRGARLVRMSVMLMRIMRMPIVRMRLMRIVFVAVRFF